MSAKILEGPRLENPDSTKSMGQFLFDSAEKYGDKLAQIDATSGEKETYSNVKLRSTRVAIELQNRGISSKDVILFCSSNTIDNTIPIIASVFLGVTVGSLDPTLSVRHVKHLISLVNPKIVFVEDSSVKLIEDALKETDIKTEIVVFGRSNKYENFQNLLKPQKDEEKFRPTNVNIDETIFIFFSSGTTGLPKAICHSHYSFLNIIYSLHQHAPGEVEHILCFTTFYWISAVTFLCQGFITGACRILLRKPEAETVFEAIQNYSIKSIFMAPILTYNLTNNENARNYNLSSLRYILTGGTPISEEQVNRLKYLFKEVNIRIGYGMTEGGCLVISDNNSKVGSLGKPLPGVKIKIIDDSGKILGAHEKGEIYLKTPSLMTGYYNGDCSDNFDSHGFLKTGDIGYYDGEENIYLVGREKEMFKYLSWHIVPSSIENVLLEHPAIKEAAVYGIPKEEQGEVPAAAVVLKEGHSVSEEEIKAFVAATVADRERLRGGVKILESLPRTPSGKVIRKEVRDLVMSCL